MNRRLLTEKEKFSQSVHIFMIKYRWKMNAAGGSHPRKEEGALYVMARQERRGVLITETISQHTSDTQLKTVSKKGGASL